MPITTSDLAREAGVHQTTVSRALRDDPRLSLTTRARIQELARARGYVPDPMLAALTVYRQKQSVPRYQETLGWITNYATRDGWKADEKVGQFTGAVRRAKELGYRIEHFWLRERGMTPKRITEILFSRNIRGLFLIAQPRARSHVDLDWSRFAAIGFDHTLAWPPLHTVANHHFHSMKLIMRKLKKLGYRRIGFACWPRIQESVDRNWTAAYWAYQPRPYRLPLPTFVDRGWTRQSFYRWFDKYRPEVVVSHDPGVLQWLREKGLRVPQDVGYVIPARAAGPDDCSGIDEKPELMGAIAVDFLVDMLRRGAWGIPSTPICSLVEGTWVEGNTVRIIHTPRLDEQFVH